MTVGWLDGAKYFTPREVEVEYESNQEINTPETMAAWDDEELKCRMEGSRRSERGGLCSDGNHWSTRLGVRVQSGWRNLSTSLQAGLEKFVQNADFCTQI